MMNFIAGFFDQYVQHMEMKFGQKRHQCFLLWSGHVTLCCLQLIVLESPPFRSKGRHKKIDFFLGKSPKLWVGGGQES